MRIPDPIINKALSLATRNYLTNRRVRKTVQRATKSPFYRKRFAESGLQPKKIKNVKTLQQQLPMTTRQDITLVNTNPYDLLCVDPAKEPLIFGSTSGSTTGEPVPVFMTVKELNKAVSLALKLPVFSLLKRSDRAALAFPMVRTFAGRTADLMVQKRGAMVIPLGTRTNINPPPQQAQTILSLKPTLLGVIPSDGFALAQILLDQGVDPKSIGVDKVIIGAEPCAPSRMERLKEIWGASYIFNFAGQNEVGLPGIPCVHGNQHIPTIAMHIEMASPKNSPADKEIDHVGLGEVGVPIITPLNRVAMPVLRYWTDDLVRLGSPDECPCGLPFPLYQLMGRVHTAINGTQNQPERRIMPIELENLLFQEPVFGVWYRIELWDDRVHLTVEHRYKEDKADLEASISKRFEENLATTCTTDVVPLGTLYNYQDVRPGKPMSRLVDHRQGKEEYVEEG